MPIHFIITSCCFGLPLAYFYVKGFSEKSQTDLRLYKRQKSLSPKRPECPARMRGVGGRGEMSPGQTKESHSRLRARGIQATAGGTC